jgi:hypothetical protein
VVGYYLGAGVGGCGVSHLCVGGFAWTINKYPIRFLQSISKNKLWFETAVKAFLLCLDLRVQSAKSTLQSSLLGTFNFYHLY